jgi:hypothetical protein
VAIRPIPDEERLDLSHYPEELTEFPVASLEAPPGARRTAKLEIDSSAFEQVDLQEVRVHAFLLQRQKYEVNLVLDIDYLEEWSLLPDNRFDFLVVPATLTFLDVVDLQIHLDWGTSMRREEPYGVISSFSDEVMIYDFRRFAYTDPIYTERSHLYYELNFSDPLDGRISLGAKDFTIVGRQEGVRSSRSTFDPAQRVPLVIVGGQMKESEPNGHRLRQD